LSGFLAALQLADSALPIGRFAHSSGLEALLAEEELSEDELEELAASLLLESAGPLDGAAVAAAHRGGTVEQLRALDRLVTVRKLAPGARRASVACGRRLAALGLAPHPFCDAVARRETDGNLAVVEGAVAAALGIGLSEAVLIELRGSAASLLSAAVRLGRLPASRAQAVLLRLAGVIDAAGEIALATPPDEMRSTVPELELYALKHERLEARLFMS
jgi:urease accessory protein